MASHLSFQERELLHRLLKQGMSRSQIARTLGRDRSTIHRELVRNSGRRGYDPSQAQRRAEIRRRDCHRGFRLDDREVHQYVLERIKLCWSPDQISHRARLDFPRASWRWLSDQTIYTWIKRRQPRWRRYLRRGGKSPERRGKLRDCVRIDGRPEVINRRRRYGDWEGDTLVGKGRRSSLVTLVERKSGYTRIGRGSDMTATTTRRVMNRCLRPLPPSLRRSVTLDNGKEFMEHESVARSCGLKVYFAMPYRSWQRGTSENTNGLLRQFFPKRTDFTRIRHRQVTRVEKLLNERPRKRLGYRTPAEILAKQLSCN